VRVRGVQAHVLDQRVDVRLQRVHVRVDIARVVVCVCQARLLFSELRRSWAGGVFLVKCQRAGAAGSIVECELGELGEVHGHWRCPCARLRRRGSQRRGRSIRGSREELHEALYLPWGLHQLLEGGLHDLILSRGGRAMQFESRVVVGSGRHWGWRWEIGT
jgi:hypothetical protein